MYNSVMEILMVDGSIREKNRNLVNLETGGTPECTPIPNPNPNPFYIQKSLQYSPTAFKLLPLTHAHSFHFPCSFC